MLLIYHNYIASSVSPSIAAAASRAVFSFLASF